MDLSASQPFLVGGLTVLAVLGLLVGSFLNVVIWRVPRSESIVRPPSACPDCGHPVRPKDNVPVVSWVLLRGRCRDCGTRISVRYPLVELGTAALVVLVALRLGLEWSLPAYLYLAALGLALALIDVDVHRLPDALVYPAYPVVGLLLVLASWSPGGHSDWAALLRAGIGGALLLAFYLVLWLIHPRGMGLGDVKLAGVLGMALAWAGWGSLVTGAFAAFVIGGAFSILLLMTGRATRRSGIPFGPWMLVGTGIGVGWGESIWSGYLTMMLG